MNTYSNRRVANHLHGLIFELKERMDSRQDRPVMRLFSEYQMRYGTKSSQKHDQKDPAKSKLIPLKEKSSLYAVLIPKASVKRKQLDCVAIK